MDTVWDFLDSLIDLKDENTMLVLRCVCVFIVFMLTSALIQRIVLNIKVRWSGVRGEWKTKKRLKKLFKKRCIILNNLLLPVYSNFTQIDHLVIGPFGILCIETKNHSGQISGKAEDIYWTQRIGSKVHQFYNPLAQNHSHCVAVKYLLKKEKLRVPIHNLVVFTSDNVVLDLKENGLPVIHISQLKAFLKTSIFEDRNVDVAKVASAIKKYNITSRYARKEHVRYVKKAYGQN